MKNFLKNGRDILVSRQSSILSAALVIALTYGFSMVLGILRERLLVSRFYACCKEQLDVYYAAFRLPDLIFQLIVVGALSAAFIPVFSEGVSRDKEKTYYWASSLINLLIIFFLFLSAIIFVFARPFSLLITGSFTLWQVDLMAQMTRVMLLAQVFFLISNFFSAMSQSHQRFLLPSLSPVVYNLGIIFTVFFFSRNWGIWAATFGVLLGAFLHLLIQLPLVFRLGFKYLFVFDWKHSEVRKVAKLMFPRMLSLAAGQIEATVSLFLATSLSPGSLTIYYLAHRLADLPVRLLGTSIGQAALPALSLQLAQEKMAEFKKTLNQSFSQILFLALPVTAIFLVLRVQFVRFAYGAKSFPWAATILTSRTLAVIAFSIFSQSLIQLLIRGFWALHDTTTPFVISLISVIVSVVLSIYFIFGLNLEIFGLALAFSIANLLNLLLLFFFFNFLKVKFANLTDFHKWGMMIIASLATGVVSWVSMKVLDIFVFETTKTLPLLILTVIAVAGGILVYFLLSKLFKFDELKTILGLGKKIANWKSTLFSIEEIIEPHSGPTTTS